MGYRFRPLGVSLDQFIPFRCQLICLLLVVRFFWPQLFLSSWNISNEVSGRRWLNTQNYWYCLSVWLQTYRWDDITAEGCEISKQTRRGRKKHVKRAQKGVGGGGAWSTGDLPFSRMALPLRKSVLGPKNIHTVSISTPQNIIYAN